MRAEAWPGRQRPQAAGIVSVEAVVRCHGVGTNSDESGRRPSNAVEANLESGGGDGTALVPTGIVPIPRRRLLLSDVVGRLYCRRLRDFPIEVVLALLAMLG
jgi:hypothetical protein